MVDDKTRKRLGVFARWSEPSDPEEILLEIIAARCLGIKYGDPGPKVSDGTCIECWGTNMVWYGNCWGLKHQRVRLFDCAHACHEHEMWVA